jgi:uncharacterized protein YggE
MSFVKIAAVASLLFAAQVQAQSIPTAGTLVVIPAFGEVSHANDEATAVFTVEEQDKDKATAASRANLKMKQGMEAIRKEDPQAALKTRGYYSYPIYPEQRPVQPGVATKPPQPSGWRVGQYLEVKTTRLDTLPKTVAAAQRLLALNGLNFGLSRATIRKLDDQRIAAAYANLNERMASIANAMGRKLGDAVLDTVDFEGSGNYAHQVASAPAPMAMKAMRAESAQVEEPSFEPGETTLQMNLVGKVKFK